MSNRPIPTFVVNLRRRTDRKKSILKEFAGRTEFAVNIIEPIKHEKPNVSLWNTVRYIIEHKVTDNDDAIIICEDDHQFTQNYSEALFLTYLKEAERLNADILSGGVSCIKTSFQVTDDLFWMEKFTGLQFTVIYRRFFKSIIDYQFLEWNDADIVISDIAYNKLLIYPFISTQKEFGYSDVTTNNNVKGHVENLFVKSEESIKILKDVASFYKHLNTEKVEDDTYENIYIPTYIINLKERTDRLAHIKAEFADRNEFDTSVIEAVRHEKGNLGLWLTVRKIIELAIAGDDDIIIICEDDHEFTKCYSKHDFLKNVIEAHNQGAGILLGGIGDFGSAVRIAENRFWINNFFSTQFTVIYKKAFQDILSEPYDETVTADGMFSEITSNKMVIFPFISTQKLVGYSDINPSNNCVGRIESLFDETSKRLTKIKDGSNKYDLQVSR